MDVLRLRIMTEKSIIGFGKFTDLSVQNLIDQRRTPELRWIYYNCSMLSFKENILELLGITGEFVIEKPGKNQDVFKKLQDLKQSRIPGINKLKTKMHTTSRKKAQLVNFNKVDSIRYSKGVLQSKNQGRRK